MRGKRNGVLLGLLLMAATVVQNACAYNKSDDMFAAGNLATLGCAAPGTNFFVADTGVPGCIFYPGDKPKLVIHVTREAEPLTFVTLRLQEVTTRHDRYLNNQINGMTPPPALELVRQAGELKIPGPKMEDKPGASANLETAMPLPPENGCYVVTIAPNGKKPQLLCSLVRTFKPIEGFRDDAPIMGEFGWFPPFAPNDLAGMTRFVSLFARLGFKTARHEYGGMTGMKPDGTIDWSVLDNRYKACEDCQLQMVNTLGAVPGWAMPLGGPCVWISPNMLNHTPDPTNAPLFAQWTEELVKRYYKGGKGGLYALEFWNEPWEPLSCAGWESDGELYRIFYKAMNEGAKKGDPNVKTVAACSIMNTEDKFLTGDDRDDWMKRIDAITDHYVMPPCNYGAMVGRKYGKDLFETETWGAATESVLYQYVIQFLACGDTMINPMYSFMMYYGTPESKDEIRFPKPNAASAAALNHFLTGRRFQRMLSLTHLPFAFQFGPDKDAVVLLLGRLQSRLSFFGPAFDPRNVPWGQYLLKDGGTITIDNSDKKLEFYDVVGNPVLVGKKAVTLPLDYQAWYVLAPKGGAALVQERLNSATLSDVRPVEIIARELGAPVDAKGAQVKATVHNLLNRPIAGSLTFTPPPGIALKDAVIPVALGAGETKDFAADISQGKPSANNAYEFAYAFTGDAGVGPSTGLGTGNADLKEVVSVLLTKKGTKAVDGNLDDWKDDLGTVAVSTGQKADPISVAWLIRTATENQATNGSFAEVKTAYDDKFFYLSARVFNPDGTRPHTRVATRDDSQYFLGEWCDKLAESLTPYRNLFSQDLSNPDVRKRLEKDPKWPEVQKILNEHPDYATWPMRNIISDYPGYKQRDPGFSYAKQSCGYIKDFWPDSPIAGDRLQIALDLIPGYENKSLVPDTDRVIDGFHAMPDTDYEYSAYDCPDGGTELWRLLAPGVPRGHYMPHQPRAKFDQGPVPGGQLAVKRDGKFTNYEMAIPWTEIKGWKPVPGSTYGFVFKVGFNKGPAIQSGDDKSATKSNGLTLHPYWEGKPSCGVLWTVGG